MANVSAGVQSGLRETWTLFLEWAACRSPRMGVLAPARVTLVLDIPPLSSPNCLWPLLLPFSPAPSVLHRLHLRILKEFLPQIWV